VDALAVALLVAATIASGLLARVFLFYGRRPLRAFRVRNLFHPS
jgi:hypothetical protein